VRMIARFWCWVFFHDLVVDHWCSGDSAKLRCRRCCRFFGMNTAVRSFVAWSHDLEFCEWRREWERNRRENWRRGIHG
jgi:hypothetical protein